MKAVLSQGAFQLFFTQENMEKKMIQSLPQNTINYLLYVLNENIMVFNLNNVFREF